MLRNLIFLLFLVFSPSIFAHPHINVSSEYVDEDIDNIVHVTLEWGQTGEQVEFAAWHNPSVTFLGTVIDHSNGDYSQSVLIPENLEKENVTIAVKVNGRARSITKKIQIVSRMTPQRRFSDLVLKKTLGPNGEPQAIATYKLRNAFGEPTGIHYDVAFKSKTMTSIGPIVHDGENNYSQTFVVKTPSDFHLIQAYLISFPNFWEEEEVQF